MYFQGSNPKEIHRRFFCIFHVYRTAKAGQGTGGHMADETDTTAAAAGTTATAAEQQPANAATTGAEPGNQTEQARTFSQADLDRIVTERLAKEKAKTEAVLKRAQDDAERKAAEEQGRYQELYTKVQAELEAERNRARAAELANMRRDTAAKFGLPDGLAKRLQGETPEELERDAQDLLADLPKPAAPNINAGNAPGNTGAGKSYLGGLSEQEFAARFGVRADLLSKQ